MAKKSTNQSYVRELGLRAVEGEGRASVVFRSAEGDPPLTKVVEQLWESVQRAQQGRSPFSGRQPFGIIKALVEKDAAQIWCHGDRSHLLAPGSEGYKEELFWPRDRAQFVFDLSVFFNTFD
jgi:hypothetical protein